MKFFRQVRQRLLTDNKFSKYLLYAVGEILLVVIGILIALQIDNWNSERMDRALRSEYLKSLREELLSDLNSWTEAKTDNENASKLVQRVLEDIDQTDSNRVTFRTSLSLLESMESFPLTSQNSTYTDLVSSGKLTLISPFELRQKLIAHYKVVEQFLEHS